MAESTKKKLLWCIPFFVLYLFIQIYLSKSDSLNVKIPFPFSPESSIPTKPTKKIDVDEFYVKKMKNLRACKKIDKQARNFTEDPLLIFYQFSEFLEALDDCDIPCITTNTLYKSKYVDALIEHYPGGNKMPKTCPDQQFLVLHSRLSIDDLPQLSKYKYNTFGYDILSSYQLTSDIPIPFVNMKDYDLYQKVEVSDKRDTSGLAMFLYNCGDLNDRLVYVNQLIEAGAVIDSYGSCLNNKDGLIKTSKWRRDKMSIMHTYYFTITFEHTDLDDYVTEDFYNALSVGKYTM
eukprot:TRINITY_DN4498_c0_g1_i3.p1 TRINITY_DN4498_c0_g1~~TRINITY_DN4498_c0_g1_i3.p1  ORF type:complete len:291 (+),score=33.96 TRINITY_DN4498_c0_g1_i3:13-885(+)